MTAKTYLLETIADLLKVPGERREDCVREILYLLALTELAGTQDVMAGGLLWTDDGDKSVAINDANGKAFLKLSIKKKSPGDMHRKAAKLNTSTGTCTEIGGE